MSEKTKQDRPAASGDDHHTAETRLRLWPALVILCLHFAAAMAFRLWGSTNIHSAAALGVVPSVAALLLIIWWLAASRAPWRYRLSGLALLGAAWAAIVLSQRTTDFGFLLLAYALPTITTGIVILLTVTWWSSWRVRGIVLALYIIGCAAFFMAMRVDSIGGDLAPVVSWRWTPTAAEHSEAIASSEVQGTAELPPQAGPADWPGFRGSRRDGRVSDQKFAADWDVPLREVWRREIGPAWSSFAVVGDYLFTQEQRGAHELVTCYRADTGEEVWTNRLEARYEDNMGLGPRATPTFDNGRLYTQGATGILQCIDAATGETIWRRDIASDADTRVPGWGFASSPLVVGDLVIQFAGGAKDQGLLAYDTASGELVWRAGQGASGYSSPHFARIADIPHVVMASNWGLQAFAPETGSLLWEFSWAVPSYPRCTQPLVVENRGILGTTSTMGSNLLEVQKTGADWNVTEQWQTRRFRPYFKDSVIHEGYIYGFDGNRFVCFDIETGERQWAGKRYGGQVVLLADMAMLVVLSEAGEVVLIDATPERFHERALFSALRGKTWNHPVVAHGRLFVRNAEEAVCFELPLP